MKQRDLIKILTSAGFWNEGGTKHGRYTNGVVSVYVPRHREVSEGTARQILRDAGLR